MIPFGYSIWYHRVLCIMQWLSYPCKTVIVSIWVKMVLMRIETCVYNNFSHHDLWYIDVEYRYHAFTYIPNQHWRSWHAYLSSICFHSQLIVCMLTLDYTISFDKIYICNQFGNSHFGRNYGIAIYKKEFATYLNCRLTRLGSTCLFGLDIR